MSSLPVAPLPQATCATHPVLHSVGTCPRCGRFMCRGCRTDDGRCTDCLAREQAALPDAAPRARLAVALLLVNVGSDALDSLLSVVHLSRGPEETLRLGLLEVLDGLVGLGQAVLFILTVVFFLRWWHLMVRHALARGVPLGTTPAMAVGFWFIPFVNLARPFKIAREAASGLGVRAPLAGWWAFWVGSNLVSNISTRLTLAGDASSQSAATLLALVGTLLSIPAALLCVQVVKRLQEGLHQPA